MVAAPGLSWARLALTVVCVPIAGLVLFVACDMRGRIASERAREGRVTTVREKTAAARRLTDDVPEHVKKRRLAEVIDAQRAGAEAANALEIGRVHCVLVEGRSKRSDERMSGRTCTNKRVIVDGVDTAAEYDVTHGSQHSSPTVRMNSGDYVAVRIDRAGANTLYGTPLGRTELGRFHRIHGGSFA